MNQNIFNKKMILLTHFSSKCKIPPCLLENKKDLVLLSRTFVIIIIVFLMGKENQFEKKILNGEKGKLMLEINKTFKNDSRFKLD